MPSSINNRTPATQENTTSRNPFVRLKKFVFNKFGKNQNSSAEATNKKTNSAVSEHFNNASNQAPAPVKPLAPFEEIEKKQQEIVDEFYNTEVTFIASQDQALLDLDKLNDFFQEDEEKIQQIANTTEFVNNLKKISCLHIFGDRENKNYENERRDLSNYFKVDGGQFNQFCGEISLLGSGYKEIINIINEYNKSNDEKIKIDNFITPIQRVPRYIMLLNEWKKVDSWGWIADALTNASKAATSINNILKDAETQTSIPRMNALATRILISKYRPTAKKNAGVLIDICSDSSLLVSESTTVALQARINRLSKSEKRRIGKRLIKAVPPTEQSKFFLNLLGVVSK